MIGGSIIAEGYQQLWSAIYDCAVQPWSGFCFPTHGESVFGDRTSGNHPFDRWYFDLL